MTSPPTAVPKDWNVVLLGGWNPYLLTPNGFGTYVFGLPEGTPLQLELVLDEPSKFRVRHDGITALREAQRLILTAVEANFGALRKACQYAYGTLQRLPLTPIVATGVNLRYAIADPDGILVERVEVPLDDRISDAAFSILDRQVIRALEHGDGRVNFKLETVQPGEYKVELNFDCRREKPVLEEWLQQPMEDLNSVAQKLLVDVLGATIEENQDGNH